MPHRWQHKRKGESEAEFHRRLNRTCYACGDESETIAECDQHEQQCPSANRPGRKEEKP